MNKLFQALLKMNSLDDFAYGHTLIHQLHPLLKLILCFLLLILILISQNIFELLFYFLIILWIGFLAQIPFQRLIKKGLIGLPLSLFMALSFLIFNHNKISFYGMMIQEGIILSLFVFMKTYLCLMIAYLLISTTPFDHLIGELIYMKIPSFFILQLTMTYRYIFVLLKEAQTMYNAYILRSVKSQDIDFKDMGSFIGHLLIHSIDESQRIYDCMQCRGFDIKKIYTSHISFSLDQFFLLLMVLGFLLLIKVVFL